MKTILAGFCSLICGVLMSGGANAQSLNVDLGIALGEFGIPPATEDGPAAQAGVWNDLGKGIDLAVVGLDGLATSVTVTVTATYDTGNASRPILDDNELIGNDFIFSQSPLGWSIDVNNLTNGSYDVYVIRPDSPSVTTGAMDVGGLPLAQLDYADGPSPFDWILGETYSVAQVNVSGGSVAISGLGASYTGLAGFQLVSVPEPGAWLSGVVALSALAAGRQRPRRA